MAGNTYNGNNYIQNRDFDFPKRGSTPRLRIIDDKINAPRMEIIKDEYLSNIDNIPAHELTPQIRSIVQALLSEIDLLKSERSRLQAELRVSASLADTDPLTGIYNRRAFEREVSRALSFAKRMNVECTLLFDLNGFKQINDNYGHAMGDVIIKTVAKTIKANLRESDVVGRIGGDEFAALLVKANQQEAERKANQISTIIKNIAVNGEVRVKCTIGVHNIAKEESVKDAILAADKEMYANKLSDKIPTL